ASQPDKGRASPHREQTCAVRTILRLPTARSRVKIHCDAALRGVARVGYLRHKPERKSISLTGQPNLKPQGAIHQIV
ncbi:hypothetical protein OFC55_36880, partial [Escherichia coli]|nr:hypothetical protein [Escherichia coli]